MVGSRRWFCDSHARTRVGGYRRIVGDLQSLGISVSATSVRTIPPVTGCRRRRSETSSRGGSFYARCDDPCL
jgi:hypothetical protein